MTTSTCKTIVAAGAGLLLASVSSCGDEPGVSGPRPQSPHNPVAWSPDDEAQDCNLDALLAPQSYGSKVKTLLTGLPLHDDELSLLVEDPGALSELIDSWLEMPESRAVLNRFFMTAFQQTGTSRESLSYLLDHGIGVTGNYVQQGPRADELFNQNFAQSFARTVSEMVEEGQPFYEVLTTDTFMMTTAMMSFLAFRDDEVVADNGEHHVRSTAGDFDTITLVSNKQDEPPISDSLDPSSPSFATFYHSRLAGLDPSCNVQDSQTIDTTQNESGKWRIKLQGLNSPSYFVFSTVVLGASPGVQRHLAGCRTNAGISTPRLARQDFGDWRMVTVRSPNDGEEPTLFYEITDMRVSNELVLHTPHIGFFTTPGFFSTWPNNADNAARVTTNQTLIVALGSSFEGEAATNFEPDDLDEEHANPASECYGCHQTLDPMRDYFRGSYTHFYGQQLKLKDADMHADFVFGGVQESGNGVGDLAQTLASHPLFPYAWAHKLCYFANAEPCTKGDELDRVVYAFTEADFDFRVLVRELFSSPLITASACLAGVNTGGTATIARRSTFCHELTHRLGIADICGLHTHEDDASTLQNDVRNAVSSVPDHSFSRAEVAPVVIGDTGLFTRANREAACNLIAMNGYEAAFGELTADDALTAMVQQIMGLPLTDPRHASARAILEEHLTEAIAAGEEPPTALKSAMVIACMSPGLAGVGF